MCRFPSSLLDNQTSYCVASQTFSLVEIYSHVTAWYPWQQITQHLKKIKQLFEYYVSSKIISNICCKSPRNSHAYDVYEVERLDDNIVDGRKQKK